jgi:Helix-turn-helix domain
MLERAVRMFSPVGCIILNRGGVPHTLRSTSCVERDKLSHQAVSWVVANSKASGGELIVLLMIATHANPDGKNSYPSYETLAHESRMSPRNVIRVVQRLEKNLKELGVEKNGSPVGTNLYSLPKMSHDKMSHDVLSRDKYSKNDKLSCDKPSPEMSPEPSLTVLPSKEEPSSKDIARSRLPGFENFWEIYPRKVGKPNAERAWLSRVRDDKLAPEVIAGVMDWMRSAQWEDPQFIPYPATFLNQKRWQDSPEVVNGAHQQNPFSRKAEQRDQANVAAVAEGIRRRADRRGMAREVQQKLPA